MAVEENSSVTVNTVEANLNNVGKQSNEEMQTSNGVAENEKSNGTMNAAEADRGNENQPSNGVVKQEIEAANENSEADKNENQTSNGVGKREFVQEDETQKDVSPEFSTVIASSSYTEASDHLCHLEEFEKKALHDLRATVQEAILENRLIKGSKVQTVGIDKGNNVGTVEETKSDVSEKTNEDLKPKSGNVTLWGVPFCASKSDNQTDTILLMFLRAREFIVSDAYDMLRNTLKWRKDNNIDSITSEDFGTDFVSISYMNGKDREGHPICYNVVGALAGQEMYEKALATPEKRERLVRWRIQLMEKAVQELDFKPGGVTSFLQVTDLKNMPPPSRKDFRAAARETVETLQDNYPEFVAKNVFINVPLWYYAFSAVLSPFLSQRTKNKLVFARPNKVTETLLKYIPSERLPLQFGGLLRETDNDFSTDDAAMEVSIKAGSVANIEIPAPESGTRLMWELYVLGWDVNYKEEFVPTDEGSYSLIVQRTRKIGAQEGPVRNSFRNTEAGKVVLTVENGLFKKKNVVYRYKIQNAASS